MGDSISKIFFSCFLIDELGYQVQDWYEQSYCKNEVNMNFRLSENNLCIVDEGIERNS